MELIFNPCGELRWSPEGPVSQFHSPHLHIGAPGIFSDLLRSVQMLKESGVQKGMRSYRTYSIPSKTAALVPEFVVENLPLAELQPRFLRLQWRTCPWAEHSLWWYIHIVGEEWLGFLYLWSGQKPWWNWYLTPVEGPVSKIHSPHLNVGARGIFSVLLRSVQMLKREWGAESNGSYRTYSLP